MKRKRYTEEPIRCVLRQAEAGIPSGKVCRKTGLSEQTFSRWKKPVAGLGVAELRRLKQLEVESRRLKALGAGPRASGIVTLQAFVASMPGPPTPEWSCRACAACANPTAGPRA